MHQVSYALAQQGWQVDMFTRRSSPEQAARTGHGCCISNLPNIIGNLTRCTKFKDTIKISVIVSLQIA